MNSLEDAPPSLTKCHPTRQSSGTARKSAQPLTVTLGVKNSMSPVSSNDWRLQGQESYLAGATMKRMAWAPRHPDNDHDHCEFCAQKLAAADIPHSIQEGYCTLNGYHWVCSECFRDFREKLKWVVVQ